MGGELMVKAARAVDAWRRAAVCECINRERGRGNARKTTDRRNLRGALILNEQNVISGGIPTDTADRDGRAREDCSCSLRAIILNNQVKPKCLIVDSLAVARSKIISRARRGPNTKTTNGIPQLVRTRGCAIGPSGTNRVPLNLVISGAHSRKSDLRVENTDQYNKNGDE